MDALAHLPMAVVVVAAAYGDERSCSTATAAYLSYDPPLLVVPLSAGSRTGALARDAGELSISVLADDQAEVAVRAAAADARELAAVEPPAGRRAPAVAGSTAALWCDVDAAYELEGRLLLVCRVRDSALSDREPLLRFRRRYRPLGEPISVEREAPYPL
jgi:flavin reductase (DIM6/NTAB) family NADH-FMN oxidoreductase RutF